MTPDQDPDTATIPSLPRIFAPPDIRWVSQHIERIHDHARRINHAKTELRSRTNARKNLLPFVSQFAATQPYEIGWFHADLCAMMDDFITAIENRESPRVIVSCPPRSGKSTILSRCFPPYLLGKHPEWEIIAATYAQDFANEWGLDVRRVMQDPRYLELFPESSPRKDSNRADGFRMSQGGAYTTRGRGGGLTGRGGNCLIIDDIFKDMADVDSDVERKKTKDWYDSVLRTRAAPGAGIVMIGTRWHNDDLIAYVQEQAKNNPGADQWAVYDFPALAVHDEKHRKMGEALHPARYDEAYYKGLRATISPRVFSALYQCNPTPDDGVAFKRDWLRLYKPHELPTELTVYVTTDYALSEDTMNDWSVICTWGVAQNGAIYLIKMDRFKGSPGVLADRTLDNCVQPKPRPAPTALIMEDIHITKTLGPQLTIRMRERNIYVPTKSYTPVKSKLARSASYRARCEQGMVYYPDIPETHEIIIPEHLQFCSGGKHDDVVDNGTLLGLALDELFTPGPAAPPPKPKPEFGTLEWALASRPKNKPDPNARHVPRRLNGQPPERVGRDALLKR